MNPGCWICIHYEQKSRIITDGTKNVSGNLAKCRVWNKHRCKLKQEHLYPNHCNFEENLALRAELDRRYPDLAKAHKRAEAFCIPE